MPLSTNTLSRFIIPASIGRRPGSSILHGAPNDTLIDILDAAIIRTLNDTLNDALNDTLHDTLRDIPDDTRKDTLQPIT